MVRALHRWTSLSPPPARLRLPRERGKASVASRRSLVGRGRIVRSMVQWSQRGGDDKKVKTEQKEKKRNRRTKTQRRNNLTNDIRVIPGKIMWFLKKEEIHVQSHTYSTLWIRAFVDTYKTSQKLVSTGILLYGNTQLPDHH